MAQLVELGYIDQPDERAEVARAQTQRELDYNLARAYMDGHQFGEAAAIFKRLWADYPQEYRFAIQLLSCLERLQQNEEAAALAESIIRLKQDRYANEKDAIEARAKALQERADAGEKVPAAEWQALQREAALLAVNPEGLVQLQIRHAMLMDAFDQALELAESALATYSDSLNLLLICARLQARREAWDRAADYYQRVLQIEPLHEPAWIGMAYMHLQQKRYWEAAANAQEALRLAPNNVWAHYYSGLALLRLSKPKMGLQALHRAVELNPDFVEAWTRLARYYSRAKTLRGASKQAAHCTARRRLPGSA